jgi:cell division protein FtsB
MKIAAIVVLSILLIFLGIHLYGFISQEHQLSNQLSDVQTNLSKAQTEETSLQQENAYLSDPVNLEKELRGRFNYINPGEKMVIIVPLGSSTASTSVSD